MTFRPIVLDPQVSVAPQIETADVAAAAAAGYRVIVGNRPDGEGGADQPDFAAIEAAARAAALETVFIPFRGSDASPDQVRALADVLSTREGPILAYCRSGTRSTFLWCAASVALGKPVDAVLATARDAGYDLSGAADAIMLLGRAAR